MNTNEIQQLKLRLLELEKNEKDENYKIKNNNFKVINDVLNEKKNAIQRNRYSKSTPLVKYHDQELVVHLEAIHNILKNLDERLIKLENI